MKRTWKKIGSLLLALCMVLTMLPMTALAADGDIAINETNFPDANFRAYLQAQDYGDDDLLSVAEIDAITSMDVSGQSISDLTGIGYFTALTAFVCFNNSLTELPELPDSLTGLDCGDNNLTALPALLPAGLTGLYCSGNNLTALPTLPDNLTRLVCVDNNLTALALNSSATYERINVQNNYMTDTSAVTGQTIDWLSADGGSGNTDFVFYPQRTLAVGDIIINAANFPDANFRAWLLDPANISGAGSDNVLTAEEIATIININVYNKGISDLTGIGYFTALTELDCSYNDLTSLPSLPGGLTELDCAGNNLTVLPTLPVGLTELVCRNNSLMALPALPDSLTELDCADNNLTVLPTLPVGLTELDCSDNNLTALPSLPTGLSLLYCESNNLTALPSLPGRLTDLDCSDNSLTVLPDLPDSLENLSCGGNNLTVLPTLPGSLTYLRCDNNSLTALPTLPDGLITLFCDKNNLTVLPTLPTGLTGLYCSDNSLTVLPDLPDSLENLSCGGNNLTVLPALPAGLIGLYCESNNLTVLPALPAGLIGLYCSDNSLTALVLNSSVTYSSIDVSYNNMASTDDVTGNSIIWDGSYFIFTPQRSPGDIVINAANFPDANFRAWLQSQSIGSDYILTAAEIAAITSMDVSSQNISNLTGIGYFTALTELNCTWNSLTALPALPNSLEHLECADNNLTVLPALPNSLEYLSCSGNNLAALPALPTGLTELYCGINNLTALPALPTNLERLDCSQNNLTTLPVSLPANLTGLYCYTNNLTVLPTLPDSLATLHCGGNNLTALPTLPDSLATLHCDSNNLTALPTLPAGLTGLLCAHNSLTALALNGSTTYAYIDVSYNNLASEAAVTGKAIAWDNMSFAFAPQKSPGDIAINTTNFPDANFRAWLTNSANISGAGSDNVLTAAEIAVVTSMDVSDKSISDLTGIEYFTALTELHCSDNNLTELPDLPAGLTGLDCSYNNLTALPVSLPANLTELDCSSNNLTVLPDLPDSLTRLSCSYNNLTELPDLPAGLTGLDCSGNNLTELPNLPDSLTILSFDGNNLTELPDLPAGLTWLGCGGNNLTELPDLPAGLTWLGCSGNNLTALPDLPAGLTQLGCGGNNLTELPDLPDSLTMLHCQNNNLTALPALPDSLDSLDCSYNSLTELVLNSSAPLLYINVSYNNIPNEGAVTGKTITWNGSNFKFAPQKSPGDIIINAANFPDANFRAWLTNGANIGGAGSDNLLTAAEIDTITSMNVSGKSISDLTGIGYFTELTELRCNNNSLTELPELPAGLTGLDCGYNNLTALPTTLPTGLTWLVCSYNNLTALPTLPDSLATLHCDSNNLTALPALPDSLEYLECFYNSLTALPELPDGLTVLSCSNNNLTALPALPGSLTYLNCRSNSLTALALNGSAAYTNIDVSNNNLASEAAVTGKEITWDNMSFAFAPQRTPVTFTATQTGGTSGTANSTGITLTFSEAVDYLTAEKITITSGTGSATKGTLSGSGTTWTLALAGITTQGNVTVSVADFSTFYATNNPQTVAVYKASGGGGGGGGGGGSSVVTPPAEQPKTETTTSGNTATATTTVTAAVNSSGTATATVTQAQISDAITKAAEAAAKQGSGAAAVVEIKVTAPANAKTVETSIPKAAMEQAAGGNTAALTVSTPVASLSFDAAALSTIAGEATGAVNISASIVDASTLSAATQQLVGDRPVFNFSVTSNGQTISQFGGSVSVSVPYTPKAGEDLNSIVIYYINAEGKPEVVSNCSYDPATGTISFKTDHFSQYAVGYNKVTFKDVADSAWYSKAVGFIAARGVTTGTGNGNYSPDAKLTRGEFIVMMMKAYGIAPDTATAENFADAGNTYYTGYLAAAKRLGISGGVGNNMFAPGKEITRQEMFTLLYNALKAIGELPEGNTGKSLSAFSDAGQVASWAKDAMTLLVKTGTVSGTNGKLTPEETTTRAQMAQVLYNLLSQ